MNATIEQERAPHISSRSAEQRAGRYIGSFLLAALLLYLIPFFAERFPALQNFAVSDWGSVLDHSYDVAGVDAEVVLFGDSSALYGIDTPRLSAALGVKAINLPQSIGSIVVTGDTPLRRYLARNKPPQRIVFYFTPWDLDFDAVNDPKSYEGTEQTVRHGAIAELGLLLRTHPGNLLRFPLMFYLVRSSMTHLWNPGSRYLVPPTDGFQPYPAGASRPLSESCSLPDFALRPISNRSLQHLLESYRRRGTEVIPVLAPIPRCAGADRVAERFGSTLSVMPAKAFADDKYFAHILPSATNATTDRLAAILQARTVPDAQH